MQVEVGCIHCLILSNPYIEFVIIIQGVHNWLTKLNRIIEQLIEHSINVQQSNVSWELKYEMDNDPLLIHSPGFLKFHVSVING
ncbi:unnamed protein product [Heterobilharzia americana]|nr:unnamed protein product [Heterobilharzia americana]